MALYLFANGPMQTTASFALVQTGATIKTMLQMKASATKVMKIKAWGCSFNGFAAALPGKVELIETDVAATVAAAVANDLTKLDADAIANGDPTTNLIQVGTAATGYTASAEGTITAVRNLDGPQFLPPTSPFYVQFPLGQEPIVQVAKFLRIRVLFGTDVGMYCWVKVEV